jgi:hypothetical protein
MLRPAGTTTAVPGRANRAHMSKWLAGATTVFGRLPSGHELLRRRLLSSGVSVGGDVHQLLRLGLELSAGVGVLSTDTMLLSTTATALSKRYGDNVPNGCVIISRAGQVASSVCSTGAQCGPGMECVNGGCCPLPTCPTGACVSCVSCTFHRSECVSENSCLWDVVVEDNP